MDNAALDVEIEWPSMVVSVGVLEMTYNLNDVLEIDFEADCDVLEITEYGLVLEYGDDETEFVDMRPLSTTELEELEE